VSFPALYVRVPPCMPGGGVDGLVLGDTVGRTPGSYGFVVSCPLTGLLHPSAKVVSAKFILVRSSSIGVNPLGPNWVSKDGTGPAKLLFSMVRDRVGVH
jgi:hypothetical protein